MRPLRLIAVLAYPGDESGEGAATLARYAAAGHEVMVVTCADEVADSDTDGSTDTGTDSEKPGSETAIDILGVGHHRLGFIGAGRHPDGSVSPGRFASIPPQVPTERLVRVLREFRPHVMITHDETENPHPDYVRCHDVAVAAFDAAGNPAQFPAIGRPWQPLKLYYLREWHQERIAALHEALLAAGLTSPFQDWLADCVEGTERVTTHVPCAEYFDVRDQAARARATDRHWAAVPVRVRRAAWPTESFELARTHVETSLPEDDLLAGIRGTHEDPGG